MSQHRTVIKGFFDPRRLAVIPALMRSHKLAVVLALTLATPGIARAGWHAKQTTKGGKTVQQADLYFEGHTLRIDNPDNTSVLFDFSTTTMTFLHHGLKKFAAITVDGIVAIRDREIERQKKQIASFPPNVREKALERFKRMEEALKKGIEFKKTGKKDKVNGFACEIYTWKAPPQGDGEACVAKKIPVDTGAFTTDAAKLGAQLKKVGGGGTATMGVLQLAQFGFPVRIKKSMVLGPQTLKSITEVTEVKTEKIKPEMLKVPAGYAKEAFEKLMLAVVSGK